MRIPGNFKQPLTKGVINHSYAQVHIVQPKDIDESIKKERVPTGAETYVASSLKERGFCIVEHPTTESGDNYRDLWVLNHPDNVWLVVQLLTSNYNIEQNVLPSKSA